VSDFVVAVSGGARGIGLATARAFAAAGARVVIGDVDIDAASESAAEIGAEAAQLDVRDADSYAAFIAGIGAVDVLVNNAGVAFGGLFLETPPELRDLQLDVNLRGVINGLAAVLPSMTERRRGHVVNVASLAGRLATPNAAIYTATKFAVVGLTEAVRAEVRDSGVRVTAVLPTFVRTTDMVAGLSLQGVPTTTTGEVAAAILRVVRRGGPALVTVPRWMAGIPRLAAFTPQALQDAIRHTASGRLHEDRSRATYIERLRGLLPKPDQP
jgi:NADP-dependent 3-hydroxy acid dehydrogenase YdfG